MARRDLVVSGDVLVHDSRPTLKGATGEAGDATFEPGIARDSVASPDAGAETTARIDFGGIGGWRASGDARSCSRACSRW
jgi:hypothetical protein